MTAIEFPKWVTVTKCTTRTKVELVETVHGKKRKETVWTIS